MNQLQNIYQEIPFYQQRAKNYNFKPQDTGSLDFSQAISKEELNRSFPTLWLTETLKTAIANQEVEWAATSGTTSDRLQIIRPKNWWKEEYNWLDEQLFPAIDEPRRVVLTTALCSAEVCSLTQPSYEKRCMENALYLNLHHDPNTWQEVDIHRMIKEMLDWNTDYLLADPVYLLIFVKRLFQYQIKVPKWPFSKIILGYEFLTAFNHRIIQDYFPDQEIRLLYGSTETGFHILENNQQQLECSKRKSDLKFKKWREDIYEIIISSWKNPFMPLHNYLIGDLVQLQKDLPEIVVNPPHIRQFYGRKKDTVWVQGKYYCLGELDEFLKRFEVDLAQYQLIMKAGQITFHYTTLSDQPIAQVVGAEISQALTTFLQANGASVLKWRNSIAPEASGKSSIIKNYLSLKK